MLILFENNEPQSIVYKYDEGSDIREFTLEEINTQYPDFYVPKIPANIEQLKRVAIKKMNDRADFYQALVLETSSLSRSLRFGKNLACARAYLSASATDSQESMLQTQLDALTITQSATVPHSTLTEFAQWILAINAFADRACGFVEAVIIVGKHRINNAESAGELDYILVEMEEMAQAKLAELNA